MPRRRLGLCGYPHRRSCFCLPCLDKLATGALEWTGSSHVVDACRHPPSRDDATNNVYVFSEFFCRKTAGPGVENCRPMLEQIDMWELKTRPLAIF